jgi:hypothetical protein
VRSPAPPMTELLAASSSFRTRPTLFLPADCGRWLQGERLCNFASPLSSTRKMPRHLSSLPALPEAFTDAHSSHAKCLTICLPCLPCRRRSPTHTVAGGRKKHLPPVLARVPRTGGNRAGSTGSRSYWSGPVQK